MNKYNFYNFEGNNYFKRNVNNIKKEDDIILKNFDICKYNNLNILEVGCSNGWRLNEFNTLNPSNNYYGTDPSLEAINNGKENFKNINFIHGTMDKIDLPDLSCDIIFIPFVFMYIDRHLLLKSISEIDRILKDKGKLIITDFYSNIPRKNTYKHINNTYIYKQNYFEIFLSTNNYFLTKLECFNHNTSLDNYYDNTCFYTELTKDLNFITNNID
jgi:ubiquinone/menaquinone biosynthesis C-methylase UbiE